MSRLVAIDTLREHADTQISDLYDSNDNVVEALFTLNADFEYPNWSWMTCGGFLAHHVG
jgi:hypothetical protein